MLGVLRGEKGALMVVKPPGDFRRGGILEVHDGVLVAIKIRFIKECACPVNQSGELKLRVRADALAIKTREQGRRCRPIETLAVKEDPDSQQDPA